VLILRLLEYGWFDRAMRYLPLVHLLEGDLAIESAESPSNILVDLSLGTCSPRDGLLHGCCSFLHCIFLSEAHCIAMEFRALYNSIHESKSRLPVSRARSQKNRTAQEFKRLSVSPSSSFVAVRFWVEHDAVSRVTQPPVALYSDPRDSRSGSRSLQLSFAPSWPSSPPSSPLPPGPSHAPVL